MSNYTQRSRRSNRGNRSNKILNILIGIVVVLIIITVAFIFVDGGDPKEDKASETEAVKQDDSNGQVDVSGENKQQDDTPADTTSDQSSAKTGDDEQKDQGTTEDSGSSETVTLPDEGQAEEQSSDDPIVEKTITNPSWTPVGTSQSGEHVSSYDDKSVDWAEKVQALSYTTGLTEGNMIIWRIGNGGSPQKSVGIVSSKDKNQKYRVTLQWVDGQGWKPEKMDVLKTLEGAY